MPPSTPGWWKGRTILSYLLYPASLIYYAGHRINQSLTKPYISLLPVICVGGVVAGGSGKTPVLHALATIIGKKGLFERPVVLTRGYGGRMKGPTIVDVEIHNAKDVGDEAILHATLLPTIVSKDRVAGALLAEAMGADVILLDDGLQNPSLEKSLSVLVMDGDYQTGNGFMIPAGPLREPLKEAEAKCKAMIVTGNGKTVSSKLPLFFTDMVVTGSHDKSSSYFGFAGIGRPEKFERTLLDNGFELSGFRAYPDHYAYTENDIKELLSLAGVSRLITTAKDFVKIPDGFREQVDILEIEYFFGDEESLVSLIRTNIK